LNGRAAEWVDATYAEMERSRCAQTDDVLLNAASRRG
jgi:hypothetical protein